MVEAANVAVGINEPLDLGLVILLAAGRVRDIRFWIELLEGAANRVERARWKRGGKGVQIVGGFAGPSGNNQRR